MNKRRETVAIPNWEEVKTGIRKAKITNSFHEGEVWWAAVGENIGVEINGKNNRYSRPVVIVKKFSKYGFLAVPLTSAQHKGSWFIEFEFQNRKEHACLSQTRTMSVKRLYTKMGTLPESDLDAIKIGLTKLIMFRK